jgi:hypothetical protein
VVNRREKPIVSGTTDLICRGLDARDHLGTSRSRRTASVGARASLKRRGKPSGGNTISVRLNAIYRQKLCLGILARWRCRTIYPASRFTPGKSGITGPDFGQRLHELNVTISSDFRRELDPSLAILRIVRGLANPITSPAAKQRAEYSSRHTAGAVDAT